jgi:hypothetical protein
MAYFSDVKKGDILYGLVFGKGIVTEVFEDGFYKMIVNFRNGYEIPYTIDGIPKWGSFDYQTVFYKNDIDLTDVDFLPVKKVLSPKKIIKLRDKNRLEVRLPSGIWCDYKKCPTDYIDKLLTKEKFHLFRKVKEES